LRAALTLFAHATLTCAIFGPVPPKRVNALVISESSLVLTSPSPMRAAIFTDCSPNAET
jgi:hypothetical protein